MINKKSNLVTPHKMLWILATQTAVILPHIFRIPVWVSILCFSVGIWGYYAVTGKWKYPNRIILLLLVISAISAVAYDYKTLIGQDAGVSLLLIMMSMKLLEIKKHQDVLLFVFLGYFIVVTNFLFTQSIGMAVYMLIVSIGLTSTLVMLSRHDKGLHLKSSIKLATTMTLQAMPIMLVLFILFPRLPSPLWALPKDNSRAVTGLSNEMSPGSISQLSQSDAVAFRVNFENKIPDKSLLYWRGPVLSHFNGRTWSKGNLYKQKSLDDIKFTGNPFNYAITLEPHHQNWLFALDIVSKLPEQSHLNQAYSLVANNKIEKITHYKLSSTTNYILDESLTENDTRKYTRLPENINPQTALWARKIKKRFTLKTDMIEAVLNQIREQPFRYTLKPPLLGRNSVDEFFFNTRSGFCEHYASSFTYLMRQLGLPARVVTGYQGGEYNEQGNYMIVRQSDAHAWTEVWLEKYGWVRFDPTFAVAPERVERGIDALFPQRDYSGGLLRARNPLLRSLVLYWDNINYKWHQWVLGYDAHKQSGLLEKLGINSSNWEDIAISIMVTVGGLFIILAIWLNIRRRKPKTDAASTIYTKFCSRLNRIGYTKLNHEGPSDFARRVIKKRQDLKEDIEIITRFYIQLRYGRNPPEKLLMHFRKRVTQFHPS